MRSTITFACLYLLTVATQAQDMTIHDFKRVLLSDEFPTAAYELLEEKKYEFHKSFTDDPKETYYIYKAPGSGVFVAIRYIPSEKLRHIELRCSTKYKPKYEALLTQVKNECQSEGRSQHESGPEIIYTDEFDCDGIQTWAYKWMGEEGLRFTISFITRVKK
jgi:hypothetical protein